MKPDLLDANVWIALTSPYHPHRKAAVAYWRGEASPRPCFCRITALALVRTLTGHHSPSGGSISGTSAWKAYKDWLSQPATDFAVEPNELEQEMEALVMRALATQRSWTDLYLAAFAIAGGYRLVTFDRGFDRYPGLDYLLLETG